MTRKKIVKMVVYLGCHESETNKRVHTCIFAMTVALAILKCSSPDRFLVFLFVSSSAHSLLCSLSHTCNPEESP